MDWPDAETPEAFFRWLETRGVLTKAQAAEALAAVLADDRGEQAGGSSGTRS